MNIEQRGSYNRGGLENLDAPYPENMVGVTGQTIPILGERLKQSNGHALIVVHFGSDSLQLLHSSNAHPSSRYYIPEQFRDLYRSYVHNVNTVITNEATHIPIIFLISHHNDRDITEYTEAEVQKTTNHYLYWHDKMFPWLFSVPLFIVGTKSRDPNPLPGFTASLTNSTPDNTSELAAFYAILESIGLRHVKIIGEQLGGTDDPRQNIFQAARVTNDIQDDIAHHVRFGGCVGEAIHTLTAFPNITIDVSGATFPYIAPTIDQLSRNTDGTFSIKDRPEWVIEPRLSIDRSSVIL